MFRHLGGRAGTTAWFVVGNRAQRCERHKLAEFWWVGGKCGLACRSCLVAILVKTILRAILKDLPPTQRCVGSVYSEGVRLEALQFSSIEKDVSSSGWAGGHHCMVCVLTEMVLKILPTYICNYFCRDGRF